MMSFNTIQLFVRYIGFDYSGVQNFADGSAAATKPSQVLVNPVTMYLIVRAEDDK